MPLRKSFIALALLAGVPAALAASDWKQKLTSGIGSEDSNVRIDAVRAVDPDDKGGVKALLGVIAMRETNRVDAHVRAAAIERLAAAKETKAVEEVAKALAAKDPLQREAAALALGRMKAAQHLESIAKLFDDKDAGVRRAAVRAMGETLDLKGVDVLLARWEKVEKAKERDFREVLLIQEGLERLTEAAHGRSREKWAAFWEKERGGYKRPSEWTEEEKKAAAEAKKKAEAEESKKEDVSTTTRDIPVSFTASGKGELALLVIHDDSWSPEYFKPYLSSLEDVCRIYYIELPAVSKLEKVIKKRENGMPYWPYDEMCDVFDEIRKTYKHQKFAVLAHGFSCMIAARYLTKYAENVSHVIMVGPVASDDAYGGVLNGIRAKATGQLKDPELRKAVDAHFINDTKTKKKEYQPKSDQELEALERKFFTLMFANPQDPDIAGLWERCKKPASLSLKKNDEEMSLSPPYDIAREKKPQVPVLVIAGAKSLWFGAQDGKRVADNYPMGQLVMLPGSSMMPWFEENGAFTDAVKAFFAKHAGKDGKRK